MTALQRLSTRLALVALTIGLGVFSLVCFASGAMADEPTPTATVATATVTATPTATVAAALVTASPAATITVSPTATQTTIVLPTVTEAIPSPTVASKAPVSAPAAKNGPVIMAAASGPSRYVSTAGTDTGDCSSSGAPCRTPQYAIDQASAGDVVRLATGVYTPTSTTAPVIAITKALTLQGGYNADFSQQDAAQFPTEINGNDQVRGIYASGTANVNIDSLTVTHGRATGTSSNYGGGIALADSVVADISNVIVKNNYAYMVGGGIGISQTVQATLDTVTVTENTAGVGGGGISMGGYYTDGGATVTVQSSSIMTNTTAGSGGGGGLYQRGGTLTLSGSRVSGNIGTTEENPNWVNGGGLYSLNATGVTITNNTITGNYGSNSTNTTDISNRQANGGGIYITNATNASVTSNTISNNVTTVYGPGKGGGISYNGGNSDTQTSRLVLKNNVIEGNSSSQSTSGTYGGGIYIVHGNSIEDFSSNIIRNNYSGYGGGGVFIGCWTDPYQREMTSANNVLIGNTVGGSGKGSALYLDPSYGQFGDPVQLRFFNYSIVNNSGGDGSAIYMVGWGFYSTQAIFTNTLVVNNQVGASLYYTAGNPSLSMNYTLWQGNAQNTQGNVTQVAPISGNAALAADSYHLTEASDAIDAGVDCAVTNDIDGDARPRGLHYDIGADESEWSRGAVTDSFTAEKRASTASWLMRLVSGQFGYEYKLQQSFGIYFGYGSSAQNPPTVTSYGIRDTMPSALTYDGQTSQPKMSFSNQGNDLRWNSTQPMAAGSSGWVYMSGESNSAQPGDVITNTGTMTYSLSTGATGTITVSANVTVPAKPVPAPLITNPQTGEVCLEPNGNLLVEGWSSPGTTVKIYESGSEKAQTTAGADGKYSVNYSSTITFSPSIPIYAVACEAGNPGNCSPHSEQISVLRPYDTWCPQRSILTDTEGKTKYHYINDLGEYRTKGWVAQGTYGAYTRVMRLYACGCPDPDETLNLINVYADNVRYEPYSHNGNWWEFHIPWIHDVAVASECVPNTPGATKRYTSTGEVLIDPDGFVFDVTKGFDVISRTPEGIPAQVGNTVSGVTVTCYVFNTAWDAWVPWPAELYDSQINPQVTGSDGYFAFFTPPGKYYLQLDGIPGFQSWRSPVIDVITQVVHVNVPYTPVGTAQNYEVTITPDGPSPASLTIPAGNSVVWRSGLASTATIADFVTFTDDPVVHPKSSLDPMANVLGWDGGMLAPGQTYSRLFTSGGTYTYSDGSGHTGTVIVQGNSAAPTPTPTSTLTPAPPQVPEPGSIALLVSGLLGLGGFGAFRGLTRRRRP